MRPHSKRKLKDILGSVPTDISGIEGSQGEKGQIVGLRGIALNATRHNQAEEALRESEEQFRLIIDNSRDMIFTMNIKGEFIFVSPAVKDALGYNPPELQGRSFQSVVHPDDIPACEKAIRQNIEKGERTPGFEYRVKDRSGNWHWHTTSGSVVLDANGSFLYFLGIAKDITDRKQLEEAVIKSEARYRAMLDQMQDTYHEVDIAGKFTFVSGSTARSFGYLQEELIGQSYRLAVPEEDADSIFVAFNEVYATEKPNKGFAHRIRRKDGSIIFSEASIDLNRNAQGEAIGFKVVNRDITERRKADDALKRSEEEYRLLSEHMTDTVWLMDMDLKPAYQSPSVEKLRGFTRQELVEMPLEQSLTPESLKLASEVFLKELPKIEADPGYNPALTLDLEYYCKDGTTTWSENKFTIIRDDSGKAVSIMGEGRDITDRKKAEEALRESEVQLSASLENAPDSVYMNDLEGNFLYGNRRCEEIIGYKREELIGKNFLELNILPESSLARAAEILQDNINGQGSGPDELELIRKDGRRVPLEISTSVVQRGGKKVVLAFARDITDRKLAEEALAKSEERYRTILERMQDSYYEVSLAGIFTLVNDSFCRNVGYAREELVGNDYRLITPDNDIASVFQAFNQVFLTGEPNKGFVNQVIRKNGRTGYYESSIAPLRDKQGKIIGFRCVGRDISERKQLEEALAKSEERYRTTLEQMQDSYYEVDLAGNYTFVNESACHCLGYSRGEMLGKNYRLIAIEDDIESIFTAYNEVYQTGKPNKGFPHRVRNKDGSIVFSEVSIDLNRNEQGEVSGFKCVGRDITERKLAEEAILRSKMLLQSVIDSTPDWMYVKDLQHKFLLVNRSFAEAQNIAPRDMIGRADTGFFPEELCFGNPDKGILGFHADDMQVFQGHMVHNPRNMITWADGSQHIYDTLKIPLTDPSGKIYGALAYSRDMTQQTKAEDERESAIRALQKTLGSMVGAISKIVEMRDPYTAGHQRRVAELAGAVARQMKLNDSQIEYLLMAAKIHDIGKMYIPAEILNKPGKLSDLEFGLIKTHVQGSFDILQDIEFSRPVALMCLQHHERLDGSGYPNRLKGETILIEAKILAVADVVEAMSSHRPYRPALGVDMALEEISLNKGTLYDPDVVDTCMKLFKEQGFKFH